MQNKQTRIDQQFLTTSEQLFGQPGITTYLEVEVKVNPSDIFSTFNGLLYNEIERVGFHLFPGGVLPFTALQLEAYHKTLLWMRVSAVNGVMRQEYARLNDLNVHSFIAMVLDQIGKVRDITHGLDFYPTVDIPDSDLLSVADMLAISGHIFTLERHGLKQVPYSARFDTTGELAFMSLQHAAGVVKGLSQSHPVYGFFGSLFQTLAVYDTVGVLPRVTYGYDETYRTYVQAIAQLR